MYVSESSFSDFILGLKWSRGGKKTNKISFFKYMKIVFDPFTICGTFITLRLRLTDNYEREINILNFFLIDLKYTETWM